MSPRNVSGGNEFCFYVEKNAVIEANLYLTTFQNLSLLNAETVLLLTISLLSAAFVSSL